MFNDYVWKTYLNGTGKEVVDFFEKNLRLQTKSATFVADFSRIRHQKVRFLATFWCFCSIIKVSNKGGDTL